MLPKLISPILASLTNVFDVMVQTSCHAKAPFLKEDLEVYGDVTGAIDLIGDRLKGSLSVSFSESVILKITSRILGETVTSVDATVMDTAAEIVNVTFGGAKHGLSEIGHHFESVIPLAKVGVERDRRTAQLDRVIVVPFESEFGDFYVEISLGVLENGSGDLAPH